MYLQRNHNERMHIRVLVVVLVGWDFFLYVL